MVLKRDIQKKRVKDLEPGDRVILNGAIVEVGELRGQKYWYRLGPLDRRDVYREGPSFGSNQFVEVVKE